MKRIVNWTRGEIRKLMELPDRPHAVAMGVACGVVIGFTPLVGIKTLLAFILAVFMRGNRLAACVVVNLHDLLFPLLPLMVMGQYKLGEFLIGKGRHESRLAKIVWPPWNEMFTAENIHKVFTFGNLKMLLHDGMPLLLGSLIFGLVLAPIFYYFTLRALQRAQEKIAAHKLAHAHDHDHDRNAKV